MRCQLWYEDTADDVAVDINLSQSSYMNPVQAGAMNPVLLTFTLPTYTLPKAMSLVKDVCNNARNLIKLEYHKQAVDKSDIAVCVKGLDFIDDVSNELVEWLEMLKLLGVDKIYMYAYSIHSNVRKLLDYYEQSGLVQLTQLTIPGGVSNTYGLQHLYIHNDRESKHRNEKVPYNVCFYQHMHQHKFIALLDIDEIIIPNALDTWNQVLTQLLTNKEHKDSYHFHNALFPKTKFPNTNAPAHLKMLRRLDRTHYYFVEDKSWFNTSSVVTLNNHSPMTCLGVCIKHIVPAHVGIVHHYRNSCYQRYELQKIFNCTSGALTRDERMLHYQRDLQNNVAYTLEKLNNR